MWDSLFPISSKVALKVVFLDHQLVLSIHPIKKKDLLLHFSYRTRGRLRQRAPLAVAGLPLTQAILPHRQRPPTQPLCWRGNVIVPD